MSQSRRQRDFSRRQDAEIRNLRGSNVPSVVAGYLPSNAGRPKPHPGDEKFPFVKDPPDTEGPVRYIEKVQLAVQQSPVLNPIPLAASLSDYRTLATIDVGGWRLLTFFVEFFPGGDNPSDGVLSLIAEQCLGDEDDWYPVGVVDGVLTVSPIVPCAAFRNTHGTELRVNSPNSGITAPASCRETLDFDVTTKQNFRLRVADIEVANSGLNLFYTMSR